MMNVTQLLPLISARRPDPRRAHWPVVRDHTVRRRVLVAALTPTHATGMCLDVSGVSSADGANVHIWTYGGGTNQQWAVQAP